MLIWACRSTHCGKPRFSARKFKLIIFLIFKKNQNASKDGKNWGKNSNCFKNVKIKKKKEKEKCRSVSSPNFSFVFSRKKNYLLALQSVLSMNVDEVGNPPNWMVEILGWFLVTADIGKIRGGSLWDICVTLVLVKPAWKISFPMRSPNWSYISKAK